jgi:hypothetical protein
MPVSQMSQVFVSLVFVSLGFALVPTLGLSCRCA